MVGIAQPRSGMEWHAGECVPNGLPAPIILGTFAVNDNDILSHQRHKLTLEYETFNLQRKVAKKAILQFL